MAHLTDGADVASDRMALELVNLFRRRVAGGFSKFKILKQSPVPKFHGNGLLSVQGPGFEWPIFERWDVPWEGQTVVLTMIACGIRCFSSIFETLVPLVFFLLINGMCHIFFNCNL